MWQLTISYETWSYMFIERNTYNVSCNFRLNGEPAKVVNDSKHLGVIVDNGLQFQTHILMELLSKPMLERL